MGGSRFSKAARAILDNPRPKADQASAGQASLGTKPRSKRVPADACNMLTLVLLLRCVKRTSDDLDIYVGTTRGFEWYWNADDEMLGRDAFEELDEDD